MWVIIYGFTISLSVFDIYANTEMASVIIMYLALRKMEKEVWNIFKLYVNRSELLIFEGVFLGYYSSWFFVDHFCLFYNQLD